MPLAKDYLSEFIPGDPGNPGQPYIPYRPARVVVQYRQVCTGVVSEPVVIFDGPEFTITQQSSETVCTSEPYTTLVPAQPEQTAIPYAAPTPSQFILSSNDGWNASARSIDPLQSGYYFEFTVNPNARGVHIGLGVEGIDGQNIDQFRNGVIVAPDGIRVYESGSVVATLSSSNTASIKIARVPGGRILYTTTDGGTHISTADQYAASTTLYAYATFYSAGDEIESYAFVAGELLSDGPLVVMRGSSGLSARPWDEITLSATSRLLMMSEAEVVMSATSSLIAEGVTETMAEEVVFAATSSLSAYGESGGMGSASLMALVSLGGDYDYGFASATLPAFTGAGQDEGFSPAVVTVGYANLPYFSSYGEVSDNDFAQGEATLPYFTGIGADYDYGQGSATLPYFLSFGDGGFVADDTLHVISPAYAYSTVSVTRDILLILTSEGQVSSFITLTREQVMTALSELNATSSLSILGIYSMTALSDMVGFSLQTMSVEDRPDLHTGGVVWVVNMETGASSQYEQYGFNSFFTRNGIDYGVAEDGIYQLEGEDDAGTPISSIAILPKTNLGDNHLKGVPNFYIGCASTGRLVLKAEADGNAYYYEARSSSEALATHRVDLGRGLEGNFWQFSILNKDGCDFEIAEIEFTPVVRKRKI